MVNTTTGHAEIQRWAARETWLIGHGAGEQELENLDGDAWFEKFEDADLAFLYQDQKKSGEESTFFKLVDRSSGG